MKNLNKILLLSLLILGCEKDEPAPAPQPEPIRYQSIVMRYSFWYNNKPGLQQFPPISSFKVAQNTSFDKVVRYDGKEIIVDDSIRVKVTEKVNSYDTLFIYVNKGGINLYTGKGFDQTINLIIQ